LAVAIAVLAMPVMNVSAKPSAKMRVSDIVCLRCACASATVPTDSVVADLLQNRLCQQQDLGLVLDE
jgi:hypothetical protein